VGCCVREDRCWARERCEAIGLAPRSHDCCLRHGLGRDRTGDGDPACAGLGSSSLARQEQRVQCHDPGCRATRRSRPSWSTAMTNAWGLAYFPGGSPWCRTTTRAAPPSATGESSVTRPRSDSPCPFPAATRQVTSTTRRARSRWEGPRTGGGVHGGHRFHRRHTVSRKDCDMSVFGGTRSVVFGAGPTGYADGIVGVLTA